MKRAAAGAVPGQSGRLRLILLSGLVLLNVVDRRGVLRFDGFRFAKPLDLRALEMIVTPLLGEHRGGSLAKY